MKSVSGTHMSYRFASPSVSAIAKKPPNTHQIQSATYVCIVTWRRVDDSNAYAVTRALSFRDWAVAIPATLHGRGCRIRTCDLNFPKVAGRAASLIPDWYRRVDSNHRPYGYEPSALPLRHFGWRKMSDSNARSLSAQTLSRRLQ